MVRFAPAKCGDELVTTDNAGVELTFEPGSASKNPDVGVCHVHRYE